MSGLNYFLNDTHLVNEGWEEKSNLILSESHVLSLIDEFFLSHTPHTPFGRGDDCVELAIKNNLALSTDFFWQDLHFRKSYFTPFEVGAKALGRAVSDLAAAGAKPLGFSLALMLPRLISQSTLSSILEGMHHMASSCDIVLSGGDISSSETLGFSITVWGESLHDTFFLRRKQAQESDIIFTVGDIGLAYAGFSLLEKKGRSATSQWPKLCQSHLTMKPLLYEGMAIAEFAYQNPESRIGLMDLSDGLVRDLPRLIGGFAANLTYSLDEVPEPLRNYAHTEGLDPNHIFLKGGEDYALIGTCNKNLFLALMESIPNITCLGEVTRGAGLFYKGKLVMIEGFDHFL